MDAEEDYYEDISSDGSLNHWSGQEFQIRWSCDSCDTSAAEDDGKSDDHLFSKVYHEQVKQTLFSAKEGQKSTMKEEPKGQDLASFFQDDDEDEASTERGSLSDIDTEPQLTDTEPNAVNKEEDEKDGSSHKQTVLLQKLINNTIEKRKSSIKTSSPPKSIPSSTPIRPKINVTNTIDDPPQVDPLESPDVMEMSALILARGLDESTSAEKKAPKIKKTTIIVKATTSDSSSLDEIYEVRKIEKKKEATKFSKQLDRRNARLEEVREKERNSQSQRSKPIGFAPKRRNGYSFNGQIKRMRSNQKATNDEKTKRKSRINSGSESADSLEDFVVDDDEPIVYDSDVKPEYRTEVLPSNGESDCETSDSLAEAAIRNKRKKKKRRRHHKEETMTRRPRRQLLNSLKRKEKIERRNKKLKEKNKRKLKELNQKKYYETESEPTTESGEDDDDDVISGNKTFIEKKAPSYRKKKRKSSNGRIDAKRDFVLDYNYKDD